MAKLRRRLTDARVNRVVFLSHCILDENVRYLGGAFRAAGVSEIVERCMAEGIGIVQMPCPERRAWGGALKPWLFMMLGNRWMRATWLRRIATPIVVAHTKRAYARLARTVADDIAELVDAGLTIVGIVGVDGSPSCGVRTTIDVRRALPLLAELDADTVSSADVNAIVRATAIEGRGWFVSALRDELARRNLTVSFTAHDLLAEMSGARSSWTSDGADASSLRR